MPNSPMSKELTLKELRHFGLITGLLFILIFGLFLPWLLQHSWPKWPWIIAGPLWVTALLVPGWLKPVYTIWMHIGHILGWINTRIILGLMFYIIITPFGLILRLSGKDPMARKMDEQQESYRVQTNSEDKNSMENPY